MFRLSSIVRFRARPPILRRLACIVLLTFVVLFPKGGFKVGDIPITWGYILIIVFACISVPYAVLDLKCFRLSRLTCLVYGCLVPFQCMLVFSMLGGIVSAGIAAAAVINFIVLPFVILLLWRRWYTEEIVDLALRTLRFCVYAAALYGLLLFFYRLISGRLIEIPFLTVNAGDVGTIEGRDNLRGGLIMKLVSTYNNGNVYGAATILLLPITDLITAKNKYKLLVRAALLLTLSRTAWLGIMLDQILTIGGLCFSTLRSFPSINTRLAKRMLPSTVVLLALIAMVVGLSVWSPGGIAMLADQSLGGRSSQLAVFSKFTLFPEGPFQGFGEMVFPSALGQLGLIGFLSMTALFLCPIGFGLVDKSIFTSPIRRAAVKGLMLYFAVAWVDGAIDYIPIMAFYWIVVAIAIYGINEARFPHSYRTLKARRLGVPAQASLN